MEKIYVRLILEEKDKIGRNLNGSPIFSEHFISELNRYEAFFKEKLEQHLDTIIGENKWSITFREFVKIEKHIFEALIYGNDISQFDKICSIITYNIPELKFHFYYGSPLNENHNQQSIF